MPELDRYYMTDDPTTCPKCGTRTRDPLHCDEDDIIQRHRCARTSCNYQFLVVPEEPRDDDQT